MNTLILEKNLSMKPIRSQIFTYSLYGLRKLRSGFKKLITSNIFSQDLTVESFEKLETKRSQQSFRHN